MRVESVYENEFNKLCKDKNRPSIVKTVDALIDCKDFSKVIFFMNVQVILLLFKSSLVSGDVIIILISLVASSKKKLKLSGYSLFFERGPSAKNRIFEPNYHFVSLLTMLLSFFLKSLQFRFKKKHQYLFQIFAY